ncbi:MAG TPA: type II toxin-antitoxin system Y4mF family antitoxin [Candidatus Koribacter sp.]|jgi:HTH-type transcriptional regulator/antitoxin HipB
MLIRNISDIAALIRERRTKLALDQAELAKRAGVSRKWIVEIERGKANAALGHVLRTLRVLGVSLEVSEPSDSITGKKSAVEPSVVDVNALIDSLRKKR